MSECGGLRQREGARGAEWVDMSETKSYHGLCFLSNLVATMMLLEWPSSAFPAETEGLAVGNAEYPELLSGW